MVTYILVNIGSGNDLLPPNTKTLPDPMLTDLLKAWSDYTEKYLGRSLWNYSQLNATEPC